MNVVRRFFEPHEGRRIHKWHHDFEIYDRHFTRYRGRSPVVLEIGVSQGGLLQMWREYFGPGVRIFGRDINPEGKLLRRQARRSSSAISPTRASCARCPGRSAAPTT